MAKKFDFEKNWVKKYSKSLDNIVGTKIRKKLMNGGERLSDNSNREEIIRWSKKLLRKWILY